MGIFDGCLLVSDIDGTLLHDGIIPQKNIEAIEWFKSEGGIFTIATGRGIPAAKYSYELSKSNAPLIALNGGVIYSYADREFLYQKFLDTRCYDIVFELLDKFPFVGAEYFYGESIYLIKSNSATDAHAEYENFEFVCPPKNYKELPWTKVLFAFNSVDEHAEVEAYVKNINLEYGCFVSTCVSDTSRYLELLPINVNKGTAIKELKKICGAKKSFAIGDYYNDVELIRDADIGAAVAAAPDDIKQIANYVTCCCEDGAVADFIKQIFLVMKGRRVWTR